MGYNPDSPGILGIPAALASQKLINLGTLGNPVNPGDLVVLGSLGILEDQLSLGILESPVFLDCLERLEGLVDLAIPVVLGIPVNLGRPEVPVVLWPTILVVPGILEYPEYPERPEHPGRPERPAVPLSPAIPATPVALGSLGILGCLGVLAILAGPVAPGILGILAILEDQLSLGIPVNLERPVSLVVLVVLVVLAIPGILGHHWNQQYPSFPGSLGTLGSPVNLEDPECHYFQRFLAILGNPERHYQRFPVSLGIPVSLVSLVFPEHLRPQPFRQYPENLGILEYRRCQFLEDLGIPEDLEVPGDPEDPEDPEDPGIQLSPEVPVFHYRQNLGIPGSPGYHLIRWFRQFPERPGILERLAILEGPVNLEVPGTLGHHWNQHFLPFPVVPGILGHPGRLEHH